MIQSQPTHAKPPIDVFAYRACNCNSELRFCKWPFSDSDDESDLHDQCHLMDKAGVAEDAFFELALLHQLAVKERYLF